MAIWIAVVLFLTVIRSVFGETDIAHVLMEGTWRRCSDRAICKNISPHCPQDRVQCCQSCLDQCNTKGGEEVVDVAAYDALECSVSRQPPSDWSNPSAPYILSIFDASEAEELVSWEIFEHAHNVRVKAMNRPVCGSNFQDAAASFVDVDLSELAKIIQSGHGDGVMSQLRMMRFQKNNPNRLDYSEYTGSQLEFWKNRTTEAAGDFAESIYQMVLKSEKFMDPLLKMGLKAEDDYYHARYSAIWLSTAGSRTVMHFDPWPSILYQFQGSKHVMIGPPDDEAFLVGSVNVGAPNTMGGGHLNHFPQSSRLQHCLLKPGEMLFIPPGWRHDVYTVTPSVSVGIRLKEWTAEEEASSKLITQDPNSVSLSLLNHRNHDATLFWIPTNGSAPKASGRLISKQGAAFATRKGHSFEVEFADGKRFGPFTACESDGFYITNKGLTATTLCEVQLPLSVSFEVANCPSGLTIKNLDGREFADMRTERDDTLVEVLTRYDDTLELSCNGAKYHKAVRVTQDGSRHLIRFSEEM